MNSASRTDDPVEVYLNEACSSPPLTNDEEAALTHHLRANDAQAESAARRLAEANLAMVVSVARRYCPEDAHVLDLVLRGNDALREALRSFADAPETSFSVHAAACVDAAIRKAIVDSRLPEE